MKKFNLFDVFVILLVLLCAFVAYKVVIKEDAPITVNAVQQDINFVFEIKSADEELVNSISVGDVLYSTSNDNLVGTITALDYMSSDEITVNSLSGEYSKGIYKGKQNVMVSVKAVADSVDDKHIILAEDKLKVGSMIYVYGNNYAISGYVVKMDRLVD